MLLGTVIVPSVGFNVGVFAPGVLGVAPVTTPMLTVLVVVVAVPIWSLSITELVLVPVVMVKVSGVAVIVGAPTTIVAVAVSQTVTAATVWHIL